MHRDIIRDFVPEAADDDPVQQVPRLQCFVQLVCRGKTDVAALLDFDDIAIVPGCGQIVQYLIQRENFQLLRHRVAVEVGVRHLARIIDKLRRHIQLLELRQRLIPN